jgi:O-antigen ligase
MRWLGLVPAWLVLTVIASPTLPLVAKAIVAAAFLIALANPAEGLLFAAGLAPAGALIASAFDIAGFRLAEAIVVAFLAGWLLRDAPVPDRPESSRALGWPGAPRPAVHAGWLFGGLIVASVVGLAWQMSQTPAGLTQVAATLATTYFQTTDPIGATESAKLLEGLALFGATVALFRRRPALAVELPFALGASAVVAAAAGLLIWRGLGPQFVLDQYARIGYRVAAHVPDVNAAGSYFVLILCLALGMSLRARGWARGRWMFVSAACALGLWWSGSRAAFAAGASVIPIAALWVLPLGRRPAVRVVVALVLLAAVAGLVARRTAQLNRDPAFRGEGLRTEFVTSSLRMIAARPLLGVGAGRYYPESPMFFTPRLAYTYGRENAHNNFLQIAVETGVIGIALFGVFMIGGLVRTARALVPVPGDWRLLGAFAGVAGFLVTCLTSHPLLVIEVASAFWVQFALVVCLGSSALLDRAGAKFAVNVAQDSSPTRHDGFKDPLYDRLATIAGVVFIIASIPLRAFGRAPGPPPSAEIDGFYLWETGSDGVPFRWTKEYASVFVPPGSERVELPLRAPQTAGARHLRSVELSVGGQRREVDIGNQWTVVPVDIGMPSARSGIGRIDLKVSRGWRGDSGGTAEDRLGVQMGEYRVTRVRK